LTYKKLVKPLGIILLAAITAYGISRFVKSNPASVLSIWRGRETLLLIAAVMEVLDKALDMVCWLWIYGMFGIQVFDATGIKVFLASFAGLVLPANAGDFLRPLIASRLGRGAAADGFKAEIAVLFFNGAGAATLIAGILAWHFYPPAIVAAVPAAVVALIAVFKYMAAVSTKLRISLPAGVSATDPRWMAIIAMQTMSWVSGGAVLYFTARGLPGNISIGQALFITPVCQLLGVSSGTPGGIGVTESVFSAALSIVHIPASHIVLVLFFFRIITFWAWLPVGWIALASMRKLPVNHK